MTAVWSQCMWHVFDEYQCSELILLCINLGLYMPNQMCTTSCAFFWLSWNCLYSYLHVLREPYL
jgi:hypothetical protein